MPPAREKFHAPLLQSVVDSVVFGRDLDFSGSQDYDDAFKAGSPHTLSICILPVEEVVFREVSLNSFLLCRINFEEHMASLPGSRRSAKDWDLTI